MPPSIPTSLNFGHARSGGAGTASTDASTGNSNAFYITWPKSVLAFIGQVLRKRPGGAKDDDTHGTGAHGGSSLHPHSKPQRKVSRADAVEALHSVHGGIRLPGVDVGLVPLSELETDVSSEAGQRQALIQATEQVVQSIRTLLAQKARSRARAHHESDPSPESLAHPRILLFGHNAEMRASYLAHSCGFGVESGNNPSDCTWPLVGMGPEHSGFGSGAAAAVAADSSSSAPLQLRDEEGITWSEDIDELYRLDPSNPAHHFDLILAFNIQLNPDDISLRSSAADGSSSAARRRNPTQKWMDQMNGVLKEGGVFAGIACFDSSPVSSSASEPTASPKSSSASSATIYSQMPSLSLPPAVGTDPSSSSPFSAAAAVPASPFASLRCFRERLEGLGFFVPTCLDLSMEGEIIFQMLEAAEDEDAAAAATGAGLDDSPRSRSQTGIHHSPQSSFSALSAGGAAAASAAELHLESLVCARFFAFKNSSASGSGSAAPNTSPSALRRSVSTGTLAANPSASPSSAFSVVSAASGSPASMLPQGLQQRPLKIVTSRPQVSPLVGLSSLSGDVGGGAAGGFSPSHGLIGQFGSPHAFPPTVAASLYGQVAQQQPPLHRPSSRASASPSPLNLPTTLSSTSACSSSNPSPKLSPSASSDQIAHMVGGLSNQHGRSHSLSSTFPPAPVMVFPASSTAGASASATPYSNHSSPGLYPATPHMSGPLREPIVITGVAMGLPQLNNEAAGGLGENSAADAAPSNPRSIFSQLNFDRIFAGANCIDQLSSADKSAIVGMRACQLSKDKVTGARTKTFLQDDAQLIQVCSKMPPRKTWGLAAEYGLPAHVMEVLDATYELAVCAGLEALKDAGFSLTLAGTAAAKEKSPDDIGLPESMRDETGVIFASSFPCMDSLVQEVTAKVRYDTQQELLALLAVPRPGGTITAPSGDSIQEAQYEYDRKLLFKLLVMANCQLAELIKARGPNIHLNTACSGTTQAIATAEDWMRVGRCKRVIVIAADVATSPVCMPYLATGFLALGAASVMRTPAEAAAPFDARRKGMILGAGSVGLVLEYATSALSRGAQPKAELLGSHQGNSAFHATLMDSLSISQQLHVFLRRVELEQQSAFMFSGRPSDAEAFTRDLIYFAHETFTSANGGCAKVEMEALASIWPGVLGGASATTDETVATDCAAGAAASSSCGASAPSAHTTTGSLGLARSQILLANSKGFTGHPMGVGFEDALAVEALARGLVPPVANFRSLDPRLAPLISESQLSKGGSHARNYVLRMAGGFGNQFAYVLYKKWTAEASATWAARLAASQALTAAAAGSHGGASSQGGDRRGLVHALRRVAGHYSYPLPQASSPNSCSGSAFVSRVNSETNLARLANL